MPLYSRYDIEQCEEQMKFAILERMQGGQYRIVLKNKTKEEVDSHLKELHSLPFNESNFEVVEETAALDIEYCVRIANKLNRNV